MLFFVSVTKLEVFLFFFTKLEAISRVQGVQINSMFFNKLWEHCIQD